MAKKAKKVSKVVPKVSRKGKKRKMGFAVAVLLGVLLDIYFKTFPVCSLSGLGVGLVILGVASFTKKH